MADPAFGDTNWLFNIGMAAGALVAGFLIRMGWKKGTSGEPQEKELLVHGQSSITDMAPVRELLKQVDVLCGRLTEQTIAQKELTVTAHELVKVLGTIAAKIDDYVDDRRRESEDSDRKEMLRQEARRALEDLVRDEEDAATDGTRRRPAKSRST